IVVNPITARRSARNLVCDKRPERNKNADLTTPLARPLCSVVVAVTFEDQHSFRAGRWSLRLSFKNGAQADVIKGDREFVLFGETLDLLFALAQAHAARPNPRQLRIVNGTDL